MLNKLLNQRRRRLRKRSKHLKNKLLVLIYHPFKMKFRTYNLLRFWTEEPEVARQLALHNIYLLNHQFLRRKGSMPLEK